MKRRRLLPEAGFTLIEVMVAALVLVVAFIALSTLLISSQDQASANTQQEQLIGVADQEIEQVRAAVAVNGFAALGMNTVPAQISSRLVRSTFFDPDSFTVTPASTPCYVVTNNYDLVNPAAATARPPYGATAPSLFFGWSLCGASATTATDAEPIQTLGGTGPAPIVSWSATGVPQCANGAGGAITVPCWVPLSPGCSSSATTITTVPGCAATVYALVTDTYLGCGTTSSALQCPPTASSVVNCGAGDLPTTTAASTPCGDARRLIVAVVPNPPDQTSPNAAHRLARATPIYVSTIFTDPNPAGSNTGPTGAALNLSIG